MSKKNLGYTPWVARKAPAFNLTLNEWYIKVSLAIPAALIMLIVGFAIGYFYAGGHINQSKLNQYIDDVEGPISSIIGNEKPQPVKVAQAVKPAPKPEPKVEAPPVPTVAEYLKDAYQLSEDDARVIVDSARSASAATNIDANLLLAMAAKYSAFQMRDSNNRFVGLMNINYATHPSEMKILKQEKLSYMDYMGNFRLSAEVLAHYREQSDGDMDIGLHKFINNPKQNSDEIFHDIQTIKRQLDACK